MLEASHLSINYGTRHAVVDVSLRVAPENMTAIVGANGAGKSSLLRALNGTIQPAQGEILLDGRPLRSYPRRVIGRHIAVVAQEAELAFPVSVLEYVLGGRYAWSAGMWGCTVVEFRVFRVQEAVPTPVGVNRCELLENEHNLGRPHACGGEPTWG